MGGWELLPRIVGLLAAAVAGGLLARRLGQNVIVGYLLAGLVLGPTGVGLVRPDEDVSVLSELGVALLLFSIGLEFSFARLRQLGRVAAVGGSVQLVLTTAVVFLVARVFGVAAPAALALGLAIGMSSTAVVLRELTDRAQLDSVHGRIAIAILLLQDVAVIPILILTDALGHSLEPGAMLVNVAVRSGLVVLFILAAWLLATFVLPRVLTRAALSRSRDIPVVIAACMAIGAAWGAHELGFSPSLGAFVAGIVLAASPFATQIRADVTPLGAIFVTLFFASVGTAVALPLSGWYLLTVAAVAAAVLLAKALIATLAVYVAEGSLRYALMTGLVVAAVGEFTFVIGATAHRSGILPTPLYQGILAVALITLIVSPAIIGAAPAWATLLLRRLPRSARAAVAPTQSKDWRRVLVIGFGPAGRAVVDALRTADLPFAVLETNPTTVAENRLQLPIELGDATQPEVLQHAGVGAAIAVVVTVPDPTACRLIVGAVQELAPGVPILARSRYHQYAADLRRAGADRIVDEEETVGIQLAREVMALSPPRVAAL
ncbi:MAG: cation:proton antiporter [Bryobacteraceae bacterium]|nr:cation:proton antiporter [Bryobacteraceae bacterium]